MDKLALSETAAFQLNGAELEASVLPGQRLSDVLREALGQKDVKIGCNAGDCGACTILLDGEPVCACLVSAHQARGRRVETLRGLLASSGEAAALAQSFHAHGAAQCGICTPGMLVSAVSLLREDAAPTAEAVEDALGGVLCRCTGYRKIITAVQNALRPDLHPPEAYGLGGAERRIDGQGKVQGKERFGDDVAPQDAQEVRLIRGPHPRAAFRFGDLEAHRPAHPPPSGSP